MHLVAPECGDDRLIPEYDSDCLTPECYLTEEKHLAPEFDGDHSTEERGEVDWPC